MSDLEKTQDFYRHGIGSPGHTSSPTTISAQNLIPNTAATLPTPPLPIYYHHRRPISFLGSDDGYVDEKEKTSEEASSTTTLGRCPAHPHTHFVNKSFASLSEHDLEGSQAHTAQTCHSSTVAGAHQYQLSRMCRGPPSTLSSAGSWTVCESTSTCSPAGPGKVEKDWLPGFLAIVGAFIALFCGFGQMNSYGTFHAYYSRHQLHQLTPSKISWVGSLQLWIFFFSVSDCS